MKTLDTQIGSFVAISGQADDFITYATAFNGKSVVDFVKIHSISDHEIQDSIVEIWITAQGNAVSAKWARAIGSISGEPIVFDDIRLDFDSQVLMQQRDSQVGEFRVAITDDKGNRDELFWNVTINSPDSWINQQGREVNLAAFSQPQHPKIREILTAAEAVLVSEGITPSWGGYQDGPMLRPHIQAIYKAAQQLNITYSNPPASWDLPGQRIRSVGQILEEGVATCLDSAMLFASCIENIGVYPVVSVIPGHAFVGYWTPKLLEDREDVVPSKTLSELADFINLVDLGYIEFFETTRICQGAHSDYETAVSDIRARMAGQNVLTTNVQSSYVVDIVACRLSGPMRILPLPVRFVSEGGSIQVIEYTPVTTNTGLLRQAFSDSGQKGSLVGAASLDAPPVVRKWMDSLLDLSLRNPLISFRETQNTLPVLTVPNCLGLIEDKLQLGQSFKIEPNLFETASKVGRGGSANLRDERGNVKPGVQLDKGFTLENYVSDRLSKDTLISNYSPEKTVSALRKLSSVAKTFQEETGSNGLFLAIGSLVWDPKDRDQVRSPLILLPVKITSKNRAREFELSLDTSSEVTPNYSLALKLLRDENINLENLVNLVSDDNGIDIQGTFEHVRNALRDSKIANFRVDEDAALAMFNFSTYRLWKDLADNWKRFVVNSHLLKHLVENPNGEFVGQIDEVSEAALNDIVGGTPISADASQALAVHEALAGKTFILQGPPGTGKSQTITNLLATALSSGKKVLFVAEKKDALDVVKDRLDSVGIGALSLDLHDKGMSPKAVREQLLGVVDISVDVDDPGFEDAVRTFKSSSDPLVRYRSKLHEVGEFGESLYSAVDRWLASSYPGDAELPVSVVQKISIAQKPEVEALLKKIAEHGASTGSASQNPWSLSSREGNLLPDELAKIGEVVRQLVDAKARLNQSLEIQTYFECVQDISEFVCLPALQYKEAKNSGGNLSKSDLPKLDSAIESILKLDEAVAKTNADLSRLNQVDLEQWVQEANQILVSGGLLMSHKVNGFRKRLSLALVHKLNFKSSEMLDFLERLKKAKSVYAQAELSIKAVISTFGDDDTNLFSNQTRETLRSSLQRLKEVVTLFDFQHEYGYQARDVAQSPEAESFQAVIDLQLNFRKLIKALNPSPENATASLSRWLGDRNFGSAILDSITPWQEDLEHYEGVKLSNWSEILLTFKPLIELGMDDLFDKVTSGEVDYAEMESFFNKAYYGSLVKLAMHKHGLSAFDQAQIVSSIKRLEQSQRHLQKQLPAILVHRLVMNRGFDGSMKTGVIGELNTSLKALRSKVPVRSLLSKFWPQIMRVTPCILASPDSVVRFLDPNNEPFDLVVFDEASQIRVANSIGALGRAKAAVIVGDSQQMPPTSVAQIKVSDSAEESEEETEVPIDQKDAESILSLAQATKVPDIVLKWHYRSADESLIAFSNKRYYKNSLNTLPSPSTERHTKGLSFNYVEKGVFIRPGMTGKGKRGTNSAEIEAIISEISTRLKDPVLKNQSIGVVTFNREQMEEIRTRLLESTDVNIQKALSEGVGGEEIFVKNLETVQGSERDVILFSVAFSANTKGFLPLNFGPLNNEGGHRRLNVAITRARQQVKIFCSFLPEKLISRNPTAIGVAHLAEYLQLAYKGAGEEAESFVAREARIDRVRRKILKSLTEAGLPVVESIGFSDFKVDLAILNPKDRTQALLGILLDGHSWNLRKTVIDRDILPVSLLMNKMGWPGISRIWTPDWLQNEQREVERIKLEYKTAVDELSKPKSIQEQPAAADIPFKPLLPAASLNMNPLERALERVQVWKPLGIEKSALDKSLLDQLERDDVRQVIAVVVDKLTKKEGPVSSDRLARYIATVFNLSRLTSSRAEEINKLPLTGHERDGEDFLFPKDADPATYDIWKRDGGSQDRLISDISRQEIANAMRAIASATEGIKDEELVKQTGLVFGIRKLSAPTEERLLIALEHAANRGLVVRRSGYVIAN